MYNSKRILAVIPARSGSKGIPGKNTKMLNGIPLLAYSIKTAQYCPYIDSIVVSTDDDGIGKIAEEYGAWVPFLRPKNLAQDDSKIIDGLVYTVKALREMKREYDYLLLLQPTQPFRKPCHLNESIERTIEEGWNSLVSVTSVKEHPILMRTIDDDGRLNRILAVSSTVRRQDFPDVYRVNGSIYINKLDESFNEALSLNDNEYPYIMEERYSIDIDTMEDFKLAEAMLKERG